MPEYDCKSKCTTKEYRDNYDKIFRKKVRCKLTYTNKDSVIKEFESRSHAEWFAHNEGDHLIRMVYLDDIVSEYIEDGTIGIALP